MVWNFDKMHEYTDTISRSRILPIAYHSIIYSDTMPARDSKKNEQDCSYRGIEYRLCPGSQSKAKNLAGLAGACRFVWNEILAECNEEYKDETKENPKLTYFSLGKRFTKLRHSVSWLGGYSANIVKYTLKDQADAWQKYFKGTASRPDFHKKHKHTDSFTATKGLFKIVDDSVYIQKVGWMKFRRNGGNPYPDGEPIELTVKKEGRYWKMSVIYKIPTPEKTENGVAVGVDLNTYNVAWTSSEGDQGMLPIEKPDIKEIRIKRYQRKLARQKKGSNRRAVTKRKIAKWKRKQKNTRKNQDHHNSKALARKAETLVREDLGIQRMSKSAKGTVENPGKNVKAKSGLNRVILNSSWGRFNRYCDYKFSKVITVDPKYTSQTCNQCGHVAKDNRKTQSRFKCMACGHADHADLNASANILASGIGATGRGRGVSVRNPIDPSNGYGYSRI